MVSREDLESFLIRMDAEYDELDEGMYLVRTRTDNLPIVLNYSPPLLLLRLKVMDLPEGDGNAGLYRTLLELNANDVVHGAYGIEDGELIISDNGPGFRGEADSVFEVFYTTKEQQGGLGLGLSIVRSFITGWEGKITAEEREGGGAVFRLRLLAS